MLRAIPGEMRHGGAWSAVLQCAPNPKPLPALGFYIFPWLSAPLPAPPLCPRLSADSSLASYEAFLNQVQLLDCFL
jgi:hypothetical protein